MALGRWQPTEALSSSSALALTTNSAHFLSRRTTGDFCIRNALAQANSLNDPTSPPPLVTADSSLPNSPPSPPSPPSSPDGLSDGLSDDLSNRLSNRLSVLNLFAHTGGSTLACAASRNAEACTSRVNRLRARPLTRLCTASRASFLTLTLTPTPTLTLTLASPAPHRSRTLMAPRQL